jgi:hypothetical protein
MNSLIDPQATVDAPYGFTKAGQPRKRPRAHCRIEFDIWMAEWKAAAEVKGAAICNTTVERLDGGCLLYRPTWRRA